jgi:hypothetical protein
MIVGISTEAITQPGAIAYGVSIKHLAETFTHLMVIHQASPISLEQLLHRSFKILDKYQLDASAISGDEASSWGYLRSCCEISLRASVSCYILYGIPIPIVVHEDPLVYDAFVGNDKEWGTAIHRHHSSWRDNIHQLANAVKKAHWTSTCSRG